MSKYSLEEKKQRDPRFRAYEEILKEAKKLGAVTDEDLKTAERNRNALGLSSGYMDVNMGNVLDDHDLELEVSRRDFRNRSAWVPETHRAQYDAMLDQYADLAAECNDEKKLFKQYGELTYALSSEKFKGNAKAEELRDRISGIVNGDRRTRGLASTMVDLNESRLQFNDVFEYTWGIRSFPGRNRGQEESLRRIMGPDAYSDFVGMARAIRETEPLTKTPTQAVMRLEEGRPGLHEPFLGGGENLRVDELTPHQRSFAVGNFDAVFNNVFPKGMADSLHAEGKDILDQVYIDGVSVNEKYGAEYAGRPYYAAVEAMKCRMMADLMNGAHIQAAVPSADAPDGFALLPLAVQTEIEPVQNRLGSRPQTKTEEQIRQGIADSQARLQQRSEGEKARVEARTRQTGSSDPAMPGLVMGGVYERRIFKRGDGEERLDRLFRLGSQAGGTLITDEALLTEGADTLEKMMAYVVGTDRRNHPLYARMGMNTWSDLVYIDGKSAKEYFSRPGGPTPTKEQIEAGITAAMMSGEHHVDVAQIGTDKDGRYAVEVTEIKPDLHFMDGKEKWYQRSRAHKLDRLMKDPKEMESRHAAIEKEVSERLVRQISAEHRERENPYLQQQQRFQNKGKDLTATYFGEEERNSLKESISGHRELNRGTPGEYGGCLRLAQLVLMGEHPEIHYVDLMNPHKFQKEKLEAGKKVAEALTDFKRVNQDPKPGFEKLTGVLATAIKAAGGINIRRELLYAMGQPEDLSPDAMRAALATPEGSMVANGLLDSLGRFGQSFSQAVSRLDPEKNIQAIDKINENSFTPYRGLNELLTQKERDSYMNTIKGLEAGLQPEAKWMKMMTNPASQDSAGAVLGLNASMTEMREWIVNDGAARNLKEEFLTGIMTLQEQAGQYAQDHKGALTSQMRQALMHGGAHISPGDIRADQGRADWNAAFAKYQAETNRWTSDMTVIEGVALDQRSGFHTISRPRSRATLAQGRLMARGLSLDEVMNLSDEQKMQEGKNLLKFIDKRPVWKMEAGTERDEALEDYADHYVGWGRKLCQEKIPNINFEDPSQLTGENGTRLSLLAGHVTDFGQSRQHLEKEPKFAENIPQDVRDGETSMGVCLALQRACEFRFSGDSASRLAGMSVLQMYGPRLAGQELGKLGGLADMKEMNERLMATVNVMQTRTEAERQQYLLQGRIPREMMDAIDRQMETERELQRQAEALAAENAKAEKAKAGDAKNPSPLRRSKSFNDLRQQLHEEDARGKAPTAGKPEETAAKETEKGAVTDEKKAPRRRATSFSEVSGKVFPGRSSGASEAARQSRAAAQARQNQSQKNQMRIPG